MTKSEPAAAFASRKAKCAVCYVTDIGFAFPTLVSAMQLRKWVSSESADVYVFTVGLEESVHDDVHNFLEKYNVSVIPMDASKISGFNPHEFNQTHVPFTTLGRFFITSVIPNRYDRILYLDGDTWFASDPSALITYRPEEGKLAAAEDPAYFYQDFVGRSAKMTKSYLRGLGIDSEKGYFNCGVLVATFDSWHRISADAFEFFIKNPRTCLYHDQSAFNAVASERRVRLSIRWNFQTSFKSWGLERYVTPAIYHFAGGGKPWRGVSLPWKEECSSYNAYTCYAEKLGIPVNRLSDHELEKEEARATKSSLLLSTLLIHRKFHFSSLIRRLERESMQLETL
jgi:lipopolysaccharide biosynthesis glycosyltransferase